MTTRGAKKRQAGLFFHTFANFGTFMLIFPRQAVHIFSNDIFSYRFILIETMEALLKYCFHLLTCYDNWLSLDFWEGTIEQLLNITQ